MKYLSTRIRSRRLSAQQDELDFCVEEAAFPGMFQILAVQEGVGVLLRCQHTGRKFLFKSAKAARQLKPGDDLVKLPNNANVLIQFSPEGLRVFPIEELIVIG
ncbi:MAG: hypothetical protein N2036_07395 [Bryobacteraceae bacterium]|nr:hypothetical protein [Bryobacteraceae bacterium]MCX7603883.1 hypothetical protein [Bryobacteraceae bacterium]